MKIMFEHAFEFAFLRVIWSKICKKVPYSILYAQNFAWVCQCSSHENFLLKFQIVSGSKNSIFLFILLVFKLFKVHPQLTCHSLNAPQKNLILCHFFVPRRTLCNSHMKYMNKFKSLSMCLRQIFAQKSTKCIYNISFQHPVTLLQTTWICSE